MTAKSKDEIKQFFQTGDKPTESQFVDFIDSYVDKSGPIGDIETAASAGTTGFAFCSAGNGEVLNAAGARSFQGITVYTSALTSAVAVDSCRPVFTTTAQASSVAQSVAGISGSWVLLATATANNSDTVDFVSGIDSTYGNYVFVGNDYVPASAGTDMYVRTSQNGVDFDSGATDYDDISGAPDDRIVIGNAGGNGASEGSNFIIWLFNPSGNRATQIKYEHTSFINGAISENDGGGVRSTATATQGVRFSQASNKIQSGIIKMYGVKNQ